MKRLLLIAFLFCSTVEGLRAQFTSSSFAQSVNFATFTTTGSYDLASGDLNNDGMLDVVVSNQSNGLLSIFRKVVPTVGLIGSNIFATKVDIQIQTGSTLNFIKLIKLNNDNLLDIVVTTGANNSVAILLNTTDTTTGIISFSSPIFLTGQLNTLGLDIADLDADGKLDIVATNYTSNSITIFRNTTINNIVSFASGANFTGGLTNPNQVVLADFDSDGKKDIVIFNLGSSITRIYRNTTTTPGSISFVNTNLSLTGSSISIRGDVADIDGDGKLDIVASNYSGQSSSIFRNTSTIGTISFAIKVDFASGAATQSSRLVDLDFDGKVDLVQTAGTGTGSRINVSKNVSTSGIINSSSFSSLTQYLAGSTPTSLEFSDIDNDGRLDILFASFASPTYFGIMKNTIPLVTNLAALFNFTGNTLDSSGFNNHGVKGNGANYAADRFNVSNRALNFNGTATASVSVPPSSSINTATMNNLTIGLWCRPTIGNNNTIDRTMAIFSDNQANYYGLLFDTITRKIKFINFNGSTSLTNFSVVSKSTIGYNAWTHIAMRLDSTNKVALFINGVLDTIAQVTAPVKPQAPTFTIGINPLLVVNNKAAFLGDIDEVNVYRKYVTDTELFNIYDLYTIYYSKSTGSLHLTTSWGTNPDGTGTSPTNFNEDYTNYVIANNTSPSISSNWTVSGNRSVVKLSPSLNLNIPVGLTITADSICLQSQSTLTIFGNLVAPKTYFDTLSNVQYLGSTPQNINGRSFHNLIVSGGPKALMNDITVRNALTLFAGINNNSYNITIGTSGLQPGNLNVVSGFINGSVKRWVNPAIQNTILLPIGLQNNPYPAQLTYTGTVTSPGTVTCRFIPALPTNSGLPLFDFTASPLVQINKTTPVGYWQLLSGDGLVMGTASFSVSLTANNFGGISNVSALRILSRQNTGTGSWVLSGNAGTNSGTINAAVVIRNGMNTYGDFVIASDSASNSLIIPISGNSITGAQTVCSGNSPSTFTGSTPNGGTGIYNYNWISTTISDSTGYSPATGVNNLIQYTPGILTQTTWYRRVVVSGTNTDTSAAIMVTVGTPGTWTGSVSSVWSNTANWSCPQIPDGTISVTINSGATNMPVISDARTVNNITIGTGATLTLNNAASRLTILGSITNNGTFTNTSGTVVYNGAAAQTVAAGTYAKLQINNGAGVSLGGAVTTTDSLILTTGIVSMGNNNLTLDNASFTSSGSATSYIRNNGTGSVIVNNIGSTGKSGSVTIPVGNTTYNPVVLTNAGTNDNYTIRVIDSVTTNYTGSNPIGTAITSGAVNRTWIINEAVAGGSNATITLQWNGTNELGGFNRGASYVARYNGTTWTSNASGAAIGTNPYTRTLTGVTAFSPFGVGSGSTLPVDFLSFHAVKQNKSALLDWETASETNNDRFEIERSLDGNTFEYVSTVKGKGNSSIVTRYQTIDEQAWGVANAAGMNTVYYRLKQIDFEGTYSYSDVRVVDMSSKHQQAQVHPNPFSHEANIVLVSKLAGEAQIIITDLNGKVVTQQAAQITEGYNNIAIQQIEGLAVGMYFVTIKQGDEVTMLKLSHIQD
jgi:hypothetical protein